MIGHLFKAFAVVIAMAAPVHAQTCRFDADAVQARLAELEESYGAVLSDISCDAPTILAHELLCLSADVPGVTPWSMMRLDTLAFVYAHENATKQMADLANPPRDDRFIATRDACTDVACLCAVLIDHTNGSLGGTSPYPQ